MAESVGMAMVGCGQIAEAHLRAIGRVDGAELVCAVDVFEDRAKKVVETYGAVHWTTSYEQVLDDPSVEVVILCLPHDLHKSFSIDALATELDRMRGNVSPNFRKPRCRHDPLVTE